MIATVCGILEPDTTTAMSARYEFSDVKYVKVTIGELKLLLNTMIWHVSS